MKCFENAIKENADAIMVSHLLVKDIDSFSLTSMSSKLIKNTLRDKYNFNKVIITDSLKMLAIKMLYGKKTAVKKAILAGNDIVMLKYKANKEMNCIEYIQKLSMKNKISTIQIDDSVKRIIELKEKYGVNDNPSPGTDIDYANGIINKINTSIES